MRNPINRLWRRWRWELKVNPKRAVRQAVVVVAAVILCGWGYSRIRGEYGGLISAYRAQSGVPGVVVSSNVSTPDFDGFYSLQREKTFAPLIQEIENEHDVERRLSLAAILDLEAEYFESLEISHGVLTVGTTLTQEFSLQESRGRGRGSHRRSSLARGYL